MLKVAIVGKPNVGKSTLFNKLCGKKLAITNDLPGVTRDVKSHHANLYGFDFELLDTAGIELEGKKQNDLNKLMSDFSLNAAKNADLLLFVVDAKNGVNDVDYELSRTLRKFGKDTILVVNKAESKQKQITTADIAKFGYDHVINLSAEHKVGFDDLAQTLLKYQTTVEDELLTEQERILRICFIGRPNVGKSSLFNNILGIERNLVSSTAGTTRDAIEHVIEWQDRKIELIDTAGMRKKKKVDDDIEGLANVETINAIRRAHVMALVIDAQSPLDNQELSILRLAVSEGRAVILVVNKMDTVKNRKEFMNDLEYIINRDLYEISGVDSLYVSAIDNKRKLLEPILNSALKAESIWSTKLSTAGLNKWLQFTTEKHIPPIASNGRRLRLKYATQTAVRPVTLTIFANMPAKIPQSYTRYLMNELRSAFDLPGCPIRIKYKQVDNPYSTAHK